MRKLTGSVEVLRATGRDPFALVRFSGDCVAYQTKDALVVARPIAGGDVVMPWHGTHQSVELLARLTDDAVIQPVVVEVTRAGLPSVADRLPLGEVTEWSLLWTDTPDGSPDGPADDHADERIVSLGDRDHPEIDEIFDEALPYTTNRPGAGRRQRGWYGIRIDGRLAAVAVDREEAGLGYIAGVAVRPEHQGQGLGTALVRTLTGRLVAEFGRCALGVVDGNPRALELFQRLGYTGRQDLAYARVVPAGSR